MTEYPPRFTDSARYKCLEYLKQQNFDLYLCYCGIQKCQPNHFYGPTTRTEYLIHYILSGKGTYIAQNETYHLSAHQAFLILPNETTFYVADEKDPWTYIWVGFNGAKAKTYLSYANLDDTNRICIFPDSELLLGQVQNMLNAKELTYSNELKREGYLFLFLSLLINQQHVVNNDKGNYDYSYQIYVNHAIEFIEHNYHKAIKVQDLANYIGISRSHLTNCFKKALNTSPQNYLLSYRLNQACLLLKNSLLTIGEISTQVGYDDALAFSKLFKQYYGICPTLYRSTNQSIEISSSDNINQML